MASSAPEQIAGEKPRDIKINNRRIVLELLRRGERAENVFAVTKIDMLFLEKFANIVALEAEVKFLGF